MGRFSQGTIVEGKYEVDRVIGTGGMGDVYLVRHSMLGQRFALKVMHKSSLDEEEGKRFITEARVTAQFENEHIVKTIDFGILPDGSLFSVMEYLEGEDLDARLTRKLRLPVEEAVSYILQTCVGLASAHREGVVHRDLKPANLFIARKQGGSTILKILDFGIAKNHAMNESLTSSHAIFGTPTHMSPEQLRSSKNVDARADLWALGVILYQLITGELPFDAESPAMYFGEILHKEPRPMAMFGIQNAELEAVIMRLLRKDPAERTPDVATLAEELAPFASVASLALSGEVAAVMEGVVTSPSAPPKAPDTMNGRTTQVRADTRDHFVTTAVEGGASDRTRTLLAFGTLASVLALSLFAWSMLRGHASTDAVGAGRSSSLPTSSAAGTVVDVSSNVGPSSHPSAVPPAASSGPSPEMSPPRVVAPTVVDRLQPRKVPSVPSSAGGQVIPKVRQTDHL